VVLKSNWVTDDVFEADDANDISTQVNANTAKLESGSTTGLPFVVDEDDMASNSAFKVPTQQSVKAYVDASYLLKANLASPTFTGTVSGITKSMVGLGNVDNTADTAKPVSTAQQTALDLKLNAADASVTNTRTPTDGTVTTAKFAASALVTAAEGLASSDNDTSVPTTAAVIDAIAAVGAGGGLTLNPTADKTTNYTAAANDYVIVNATGTVVVTAPAAPGDGDPVAVYIRAGSSNVSFTANSGQELFYNGSAVTTFALQASGAATVGLSLWKYETTGAYWYLVNYTVLPSSNDIVDSGVAGRLVIQAEDEAELAALVGLEVGVDVQAFDADLAAFAALSPSNDDIVQRKSGAWTNRTMAQLKSDLALNNVTNNAQYYSGGTDVPVTDGGTGRSTSTTAYGVLAAGTTATGAHQTISPGTSGHFLKSAGGSALAAFAAITQGDVASLTSDLAAKAPLASPTFTGTPTGITATHVGLGNVDNTSDAAKPVSTAQQTALDLKAPLASPTFTGTVSGVTKSHVGLGNVDNTADSAKPVSTAQQTALDLKLNANDASVTNTRTPTDGTVTTAKFAGSALVTAAEGLASSDNDTSVPTTAAVIAQVDSVTVDRFVFDGTGIVFGPDGPTTALSGHTITWSGGGYSTDNGNGEHGFFAIPSEAEPALYMESALDNDIHALGCGFFFSTYGTDTLNSSICLAATNATPVALGDTSYRMSAHVYTTREALTVTLWDASGAGQIILVGYTYDVPLELEKRYEFGWVIEDDSLILLLPDGQIRHVTDSRISAWLAPNFFAESFSPNTTDSLAFVTDVWASTAAERLVYPRLPAAAGGGGGTVGDELLWVTRGQGRKIPARRTEFRTKANTSSPAVVEDTGQTVVYSHTPSDAALKIADGRLTFTPTTVGAGYRYFDAGAALTRLGARFVFNGSGKTTVGGSVTFAMMNQSVASMNTALRIGVHVSIAPIGWEVTKLSNATGSIVSTTLAAGQFPAMLAVDNITEYEADIYHQAGSTSATVKLPLGLAVTVTDSDLATWAGNHGFIECFTGLATDILPAFTETWSDTGTQIIPSSDPATENLNARGEVAYAQIVTSPTLATASGSGAAVSGLSVTVPFRGRPVMLEANLGFLKNSSGAGVALQIVNSSGAVLQQADVIMVAGPLDYVQAPLLKYRIPAGTSQDTYTVRAYGPSGSQMNMQGTPAYIHAVAL